jgi:hypothetical protein
MTSPSQPDGPEHKAPSEPLPPTADEPLPPAAGGRRSAAPAGRSAGPVPDADEKAAADEVLVGSRTLPSGRATGTASGRDVPVNGNSFSAGFARQHFFSGVRFLKPGRRVGVAVAGVTAISAIAVGVTAGVSHLGGNDHPSVQSAASSKPLATASGTVTGGSTAPSGAPSSTTPGKKPVGNVPGAPTANVSGVPVVPGAPRPPGAPPAGNTDNTGSTGTGNSGSTVPTTNAAVPPPVQSPTKPPVTPKPITFTGGLVVNFGSSQRCLATSGGSRSAGAQLVLANCNRNDPSQGWTFPSDGTARDFGGTMCLEVASPGNGARVRLANCSSSRRAYQTFTLKNSFDLVDITPDLCVDAEDNGTAAGTVLQLWSCTGNGNQKWQMD